MLLCVNVCKSECERGSRETEKGRKTIELWVDPRMAFGFVHVLLLSFRLSDHRVRVDGESGGSNIITPLLQSLHRLNLSCWRSVSRSYCITTLSVSLFSQSIIYWIHLYIKSLVSTNYLHHILSCLSTLQ